MNYDLFLFDADDTLFDFGTSEKKAFAETLLFFGIKNEQDDLYSTYKIESRILWNLLEQGKITIDHLKVERFRKTLKSHNIDICSKKMNEAYLKILPEQAHLNDYASEICKFLSKYAKIGIITNGIEKIQKRRLEKSGLKDTISFMVTYEECGFAKPDKRFFEYTMNKVKGIGRDRMLVIGDRLESDIEGAHAFGLDACWYNPRQLALGKQAEPKYQICQLSELREVAIS